MRAESSFETFLNTAERRAFTYTYYVALSVYKLYDSADGLLLNDKLV